MKLLLKISKIQQSCHPIYWNPNHFLLYILSRTLHVTVKGNNMLLWKWHKLLMLSKFIYIKNAREIWDIMKKNTYFIFCISEMITYVNNPLMFFWLWFFETTRCQCNFRTKRAAFSEFIVTLRLRIYTKTVIWKLNICFERQQKLLLTEWLPGGRALYKAFPVTPACFSEVQLRKV